MNSTGLLKISLPLTLHFSSFLTQPIYDKSELFKKMKLKTEIISEHSFSAKLTNKSYKWSKIPQKTGNGRSLQKTKCVYLNVTEAF